MKQKFTFVVDDKKEKITLREAAESDPGSFLVVHEEQYDYAELQEAVAAGQDRFMDTLRRKKPFSAL